MKKTFKLEHSKIKVPRVVDSVKHEIRKYLKKERKKSLPEGAKYWGFDCKLGASEETAVEVQLPSLTKSIDALVEKNILTIYVQITAKALEGGGTPPVEKPEVPEVSIEPKETEEQPLEEHAAETAPQTAKSIWPTQSLKSSQED
jgi:hypothetical protein